MVSEWFFSLILVGYAFSFSLPLRNWVRFLILAISPLAAILCNLIRILPTVWVYGSRSESFADRFHLYSGWLMLVVALLILLGILRIIKMGDDSSDAIFVGWLASCQWSVVSC